MMIIDPHTKEQFLPMRSNQIYASKANRIRFNNLKAAHKRKIKQKADKALDKNRNICKELLEDRKSIIKSKDLLDALKFDYRYCTHFEELDGRNYPAVYEFIIAKLTDSRFKIVKNYAY